MFIGSMAGLAFGMIFLGIALSGGVYYLFLRGGGGSTAKGLSNPLHGLSNISS